MEQHMGDRQRWTWLLSGVSAAIAAGGCGLGWVWVLLAGVLSGLYYIYMDKRAAACGAAARLTAALGTGGRILAVLILLWTILTMAWTANLADAAFPMVEGFPVLGWVILALAAWGSRKGAAACARCAGVLCLFLVVLYGVVVVFAAPDAEIADLRPYGHWLGEAEALGLCLLPGCIWYLPCRKTRKRPAWGMALVFALGTGALAAVTAGVLTPELAATLPSPLYALAQSVSLFGVLERIEPLLSAAMTMGVFCLLSAMACTGQILADQVRPFPWSGAVCCAAAGALMGVVRVLPAAFLTVGAVIFWAAVPLAVQWGSRRPRISGV